MTVKKATKCGGYAAIISRQRLQNSSQQIDMKPVTKLNSPPVYNIMVGFNEKDQLELKTEDGKSSNESDDKAKLMKHDFNEKHSKVEMIKIEDIVNCISVETFPNCEKTLVFYTLKYRNQEALAVKFENEQDFKRIYFTYKYFKMRNRLTKNGNFNPPTYASTENLYNRKKNSDDINTRKNSMDYVHLIDKKIGSKNEYDLMQTTDNNGVTHISVQQKLGNNRFDQPMSLIGIRSKPDLGEIDSVIYTDSDIPLKPQKRKPIFSSKTKSKAPLPPSQNELPKNIMKGQFVRVNVERAPDLVSVAENKISKMPDLVVSKDSKGRIRTSPTNNVWSSRGINGYESDREEWRSSRSQFSTSAFDSLSRPSKMALTSTLRKPFARSEPPVPQYYRLSNDSKPPTGKLNNSKTFNQLPRVPASGYHERNNQVNFNTRHRVGNLNEHIPQRNHLNNDHRKFTSMQNLDLTKRNILYTNDLNNNIINKKNNLNETKKSQAYSNISTKLSGLTNKLKELSSGNYNGNSISRLKSQSQNDVANLKPVIKKSSPISDGPKRQVVRTCSAEPPKKVTFSAFATVQVV